MGDGGVGGCNPPLEVLFIGKTNYIENFRRFTNTTPSSGIYHRIGKTNTFGAEAVKILLIIISCFFVVFNSNT